MLIQVLDGQGIPHWVTWQGQDQINDYSGALGASAVATPPVPQIVLPVNALRAGWLFQNTSANPMPLNVLTPGGTPAPAPGNSWNIYPGEAFPPPGFPVPPGVVQVFGSPSSQLGDTFTCVEWVNAANE